VLLLQVLSPCRVASSDCSPYTESYTYTANLWALCLVQGPFSVARVQTLLISSSLDRLGEVAMT
jgi:hypothetical protein